MTGRRQRAAGNRRRPQATGGPPAGAVSSSRATNAGAPANGSDQTTAIERALRDLEARSSDASARATVRKQERPSQRPRRAVVRRRRRVAALAAAIVLAIAAWLIFSAFQRGPTDFAGTWYTSSNLLGSPQLVIRKQGSLYTVQGLDVFGHPDKTVSLAGGQLVAAGTTASGNRWQLVLQLLDDNNQILATLATTGQPAQIDRYTRQ